MKNDIKKLHESFYDQVVELPTDDLGDIVYNKQKKLMNSLNDKNTPDYSGQIAEIIENVEFNKRAFLISKMYMAILEHDISNNERHFIAKKRSDLYHVITVIGEIDLFKSLLESLYVFKKKNNINTSDLNFIEHHLDELVNMKMDFINIYKDDLSILKDVLTGDKEERELYRPLDDWEFMKNNETNLKEIFNDVYHNEYSFKLAFNGPAGEYLECALSDLIDGIFLDKKDGLYSMANNRTNELLKQNLDISIDE